MDRIVVHDLVFILLLLGLPPIHVTTDATEYDYDTDMVGTDDIGSYHTNRKWQLYGYDMSDDQAKCQFGPGWSNLMGGCYLITHKGVAWGNAAEVCRNLDPLAEFGTLWTMADMDFVSRMARSRGLAHVYLNGKFDPKTADFRWHLRRPVVPSYTPWASAEPRANTTGLGITLAIDTKTSVPGYLGTSLMGRPFPALCKRPAKGFRRRSSREILQYVSRLSRGPNGWQLTKGRSSGGGRSAGGSGSRGGRGSRSGSVGQETQGFRSAGPRTIGKLTSNQSRGGSPAAASVIGTSSTAEPRTLPPPISKDRNFLQKAGHFEPVLPVSSLKAKDSHNLEVSAIEPVDVVDIVKAREDKLNEIYGRSALRLKDSMAFYPEDYRYPTTDYQRMAHVLTTELLAQNQREQKTDAPYEVAKVLTMKLFAEGRAIQCFFGEKDEAIGNRQVECIATAGVIDACVKQLLLSGKIIRGCGLPGTDHQTKKEGCVGTPNGGICYCKRDNCNSSHRNSYISASLTFFFIGLSVTYGRLFIL